MAVSFDRVGERWRSLSPLAQDALIAGVCFVFGTVLLLTGLANPFSTVTKDLGWRFAILTAICGAEVCRRRHPIAALLVGLTIAGGDALLGLSIPVVFVITDLIYAATLYSSAVGSRAIVRGTATLGVAIVLIVALITGEVRPTLLTALITAGLFTAPLQWALGVRYHRDRALWERERAVTARQLAEFDHVTARQADRDRMARDLHDLVSGHLSAVALQSEALLRGNRDSMSSARLEEILSSIRRQSVAGLAEMRTLIDMLRRSDIDGPLADLDELPGQLSLQLPLLAEQVSATGAELDVDVVGNFEGVPPLLDQVAHRVVAEALTNAMRHAPGQPISLQVTICTDWLTLVVENELPSSRSRPGGDGHGLANMLARVAAVGGRFTVGPEAANWVVRAELPTSSATARADADTVIAGFR